MSTKAEEYFILEVSVMVYVNGQQQTGVIHLVTEKRDFGITQKNRGSNVTDIYTQVSYAIHEMNTTHASVSPHSGFNNMTNIAQATAYFQRNFEGIMDASVGERIRRAQQYYNIISIIPK